MKKIKILAVISAVAVSLLLYLFLNSLDKPTEIAKVSVITAASDIPANTLISFEMVKLKEISSEAAIPRAVTDLSDVVGKVSQEKIYMGQQIVSSQLIAAGKSSKGTLAYALSPGMRAITVSVSVTSGVGNMISPGNHIDIIALSVFEEVLEEDGGMSPETDSFAVLCFENITVLAVDNVLSAEGKPGASYATLTLQVTPEQALELSVLDYELEFRATLRSPLDEEILDLPAVSLGDVIDRRSGRVLSK